MSFESSSRAPGEWGIVFGRIWAGEYDGPSNRLAVERQTDALPLQIVLIFYAQSDGLYCRFVRWLVAVITTGNHRSSTKYWTFIVGRMDCIDQ